MITVHHLEQSRSQRVLWLLEELGQPYELKVYRRDPKTLLAPPELKAVHPLGKSPVIDDGGQVLAESAVILDYLVERYGAGRAEPLQPPAGSPERLQYNYWMHYAEGSLMPPLVMTLVFRRVETAPMPFFVRPIARGIAQQVRRTFLNPTLDAHMGFVEAHLARHEWFAGPSFSTADVQMSFAVEAALSRVPDAGRYPRMAAWLRRIQARPAWQRAQAKAGPSTPLG